MRALVTGGTGLIGSHLALALLRRGEAVRVLARSPAKAAALAAAGAEVVPGDLARQRMAVGLAAGVDVIFHLASAMRGSGEDFERTDIRGTEALLAEAERAGVRRVVYPGTLSSYDLVGARPGATLDEHHPLDRSGRLGAYALAKMRAEALVRAARRPGGLESVILRLGLTCGGSSELFPSHVGSRLDPQTILIFGDGAAPLPLVHVDNTVEALILAGSVPGIDGEIFNIVDEPALTQLQYLALYERATGRRMRLIRAPRAAYYLLGALSGGAARVRGREAATTLYRVRARLRPVYWDCRKARERLQWRPRVSLEEGLSEAFRAQASGQLPALAPPVAP